MTFIRSEKRCFKPNWWELSGYAMWIRSGSCLSFRKSLYTEMICSQWFESVEPDEAQEGDQHSPSFVFVWWKLSRWDQHIPKDTGMGRQCIQSSVRKPGKQLTSQRIRKLVPTSKLVAQLHWRQKYFSVTETFVFKKAWVYLHVASYYLRESFSLCSSMFSQGSVAQI